MTYLITFVCYGCHLHGDVSGSVDKDHNLPGSRVVEVDPVRAAAEWARMNQPPYELDAVRRDAVMLAVREVCAHRQWRLLAAHVRSNHVHTVVSAEVSPERIMNDFKAYSSRLLNRTGVDAPERRRWARHGSSRWL